MPYARSECPLHSPAGPGESLLVIGEQGLGDCLQFVRYVPLMAEQTGPITICVHQKPKGLIEASGLAERTLSPAAASTLAPLPWLPLFSLPQILGVSPENAVVTGPYLPYLPYLKVPEDATTTWGNLLRSSRLPLVGLHWQWQPHGRGEFKPEGAKLSSK